MELKGKTILFLGDSITEGGGMEPGGIPYWAVMAQKTGATCIGYGIGGTRIAKQNTPSRDPVHDWYFASRVPGMNPDADAVVVLGGTNDFGHGDAPLGTMADRTADTFYGGMHELCVALIEKYPAAQLVIMTPTHRRDENDVGFNEWGVVRRVAPFKRYVEIVREVAEYYSIPVLDLYAAGGLQPFVPVEGIFAPDGLHPHQLGHNRIADKLISFFETL